MPAQHAVDAVSGFGLPSPAQSPVPMPPPVPEEVPFWRAEDTETSEEFQQEEPEEIIDLDNEERQSLTMLLTCGRRSKRISVMGHEVVIQNLNTDDDLRVGLFGRDFQGAPLAEQRSYQLAVCAAAIRTVDGKTLVSSLREFTPDELFDEKVETLRKYYPVVLTKIYREVLKLDAEFYELAEKLKLVGKDDG